jgi:hypothetical protein
MVCLDTYPCVSKPDRSRFPSKCAWKCRKSCTKFDQSRFIRLRDHCSFNFLRSVGKVAAMRFIVCATKSSASSTARRGSPPKPIRMASPGVQIAGFHFRKQRHRPGDAHLVRLRGLRRSFGRSRHVGWCLIVIFANNVIFAYGKNIVCGKIFSLILSPPALPVIPQRVRDNAPKLYASPL